MQLANKDVTIHSIAKIHHVYSIIIKNENSREGKLAWRNYGTQ
jgi:hypothetical protein